MKMIADDKIVFTSWAKYFQQGNILENRNMFSKIHVIFMGIIAFRVLPKLKGKHLSCCPMMRGSVKCARQLAFCQL
jgi:hypothetical protein